MEGVISGSHSTESQVMTECERESVLVDFNMDRNRLRLACPLGKAGKKEPLPVSFLTREPLPWALTPSRLGSRLLPEKALHDPIPGCLLPLSGASSVLPRGKVSKH